MIDRYGRAIEADFHSQYGVDLLDFFRDVHPWGKFWRLLSQLGSDSRYIKAQLDDPDVAALIAEEAETGEDEKRWSPQAADWSLDRELLASIRDLLADITVITGRGLPSNGTRKFADRFPRPESEVEKAREKLRASRTQQYDDKLLTAVEQGKARWRAMQAAEAEAQNISQDSEDSVKDDH